MKVMMEKISNTDDSYNFYMIYSLNNYNFKQFLFLK